MKPWENHPVELPDGRLICAPHGLVVRGRCCVDYSFMDEVLQDSGGENSDEDNKLYNELSPGGRAAIDARWGPPSTGTGRVLPTVFIPSSSSSKPEDLFPAGKAREAIPYVPRFIHRYNPKTFLIYTDGACLNNGQANPRAGWACIFRPLTPTPTTIIAGSLEHKGPFGDSHNQTSNRAELRAVLGALRFRHWPGEGFTTLVIATDSEYVVKGATEWVQGWLRKGWRTSVGGQVKSKDLWEALLGEMERWDKFGLKVQFWRIPREWNVDADLAAKEAAQGDDVDTWREVSGVLC
ncbi:hypothetical protein FSARC_5601 [Fusarium sarcochroum]|uniref:ribonuclease H n=1 Tax=Fusarium sarcochroum TaxID=1208366 RepID=A0A8H4XA79_9HYPO|nr:hypothetical protein FSARC_5601 [Fusarium sarcochroum]